MVRGRAWEFLGYTDYHCDGYAITCDSDQHCHCDAAGYLNPYSNAYADIYRDPHKNDDPHTDKSSCNCFADVDAVAKCDPYGLHVDFPGLEL